MRELHNTTYMRRSLVTSTAHIPMGTNTAMLNDDVEMLEDGDIYNVLSYDKVDGGWNIFVSDLQVEMAKESGHPELAALIELAYRQDFAYLVLDMDAPELPESFGKPVFEW
jgi:hypothetical protein